MEPVYIPFPFVPHSQHTSAIVYIPQPLPTTPMPPRNSPSAPHFDSSRTSELLRYFDDVEFLLDSAMFYADKAQKDWTMLYIDSQAYELWEGLPEAKEPYSFTHFREAVIAMYPEVDPGRRYTYHDIAQLVEKWRQRGIGSSAQLGKYRREFLAITSFLMQKGRIADCEQRRLFVSGIPQALTGLVAHRLQLLHPAGDPDDSYSVDEVYQAGLFVLRARESSFFSETKYHISSTTSQPSFPIASQPTMHSQPQSVSILRATHPAPPRDPHISSVAPLSCRAPLVTLCDVVKSPNVVEHMSASGVIPKSQATCSTPSILRATRPALVQDPRISSVAPLSCRAPLVTLHDVVKSPNVVERMSPQVSSHPPPSAERHEPRLPLDNVVTVICPPSLVPHPQTVPQPRIVPQHVPRATQARMAVPPPLVLPLRHISHCSSPLSQPRLPVSQSTTSLEASPLPQKSPLLSPQIPLCPRAIPMPQLQEATLFRQALKPVMNKSARSKFHDISQDIALVFYAPSSPSVSIVPKSDTSQSPQVVLDSPSPSLPLSSISIASPSVSRVFFDICHVQTCVHDSSRASSTYVSLVFPSLNFLRHRTSPLLSTLIGVPPSTVWSREGIGDMRTFTAWRLTGHLSFKSLLLSLAILAFSMLVIFFSIDNSRHIQKVSRMCLHDIFDTSSSHETRRWYFKVKVVVVSLHSVTKTVDIWTLSLIHFLNATRPSLSSSRHSGIVIGTCSDIH